MRFIPAAVFLLIANSAHAAEPVSSVNVPAGIPQDEPLFYLRK
jgi:hypothetical protein